MGGRPRKKLESKLKIQANVRFYGVLDCATATGK